MSALKATWTRRQIQQVAEGEYLDTYEAYGEDDAGSRCGFSDAELAQFRAWLAPRGLTVRADDRGLRVVAAGRFAVVTAQGTVLCAGIETREEAERYADRCGRHGWAGAYVRPVYR